MEIFLSNPTGRIILSIILGLGLAALFKKVCYDEDDCLVVKYQVPKPVKNIKKFVSKDNNDNCIQYTQYPTSCPRS